MNRSQDFSFFFGCFLRYHFSKAFLFFHDSWISFRLTVLSLIIKRSFYSADPFSLNDVFCPPNCCHKIANVYVFSSSKHYRTLVKVNVDCHSITRLTIQHYRQQYHTFCEKWKKNKIVIIIIIKITINLCRKIYWQVISSEDMSQKKSLSAKLSTSSSILNVSS